MAGTLTITDGTTTVDLYDTTALHLSRDGWKPAVAAENAAGDGYEDVTEVIKCEWGQTTDNTRDATIQAINRLAARATENTRRRKITEPVYLWVGTPSETNKRYAIIKNIYSPELDPGHWGPDQPITLTLLINREGDWRYLAPNTSPQSSTSLVSGTITNQSAGATVNYLDVAAARVLGDALAAPILQVTALTALQKNMLIAVRSRPVLADVTAFNPHFNAVDFGDTTYIAADAAAPGGRKWSRTTVGAATMTNYVALPAGLSVYAGSFIVYAVVQANTANMSLQVGHSTATAFAKNATPATAVPATTNHMPLYLGRITLPPSGAIPGVNNPANYYLNFKVTWTGGGTFSMRNVYIVPVDDGVFSLDNPDLAFFVDSLRERAWNVDNSGSPTNAYMDAAPTPRGRYLRLKPNQNHRIMFFFNQTDAAGGVNPAHTATVNVRAVLRCLAIRGNT